MSSQTSEKERPRVPKGQKGSKGAWEVPRASDLPWVKAGLPLTTTVRESHLISACLLRFEGLPLIRSWAFLNVEFLKEFNLVRTALIVISVPFTTMGIWLSLSKACLAESREPNSAKARCLIVLSL